MSYGKNNSNFVVLWLWESGVVKMWDLATIIKINLMTPKEYSEWIARTKKFTLSGAKEVVQSKDATQKTNKYLSRG
jgi:hypothetical protein